MPASEAAQARLNAVRRVFLNWPLSAGLKAAMAVRTGRARWRLGCAHRCWRSATMRAATPLNALDQIGFAPAESG
ncbi:MAG: hypothetical protein U1E35_01820 [Rhodospirillales bacterium]